ncbi:MAG TPA: GspE/PulE family protein [Clostridiaceae bacterium]
MAEWDFIEFDSTNINIRAIACIPLEIAEKYIIFPYKLEKNQLQIISSQILNKEAIEHVRNISKKEVKFSLGDGKLIEEAIEEFYRKKATEIMLLEIEEESKERNIVSEKVSNLIGSSPIVKLTNYILNSAVNTSASDIHMEPNKGYVQVRFRVDGILREDIKFPINIYNSILTRIKVMAKMDIIEKRIPQDGKFELSISDSTYDFRVSTMPIIFGEKLVLRILYKSTSKQKIEALFKEDALILVKSILSYSHGIFLVTGPTGSGKSTTLYAMLNYLNNKEKNIITLEDPVEYILEGISQININSKLGLTFAKGLRSVLRQDPDIIMLGEIRDEETAEIAVRAAITGHLVLATIHTNDSYSAILRLLDMGVPRYLISDALIGVMAQRLVRSLCPYCRGEDKIKEEYNLLNIPKGNRIYKAIGCTRCNNTGYKGRMVISEILSIDSKLRERIINCNSIDELRLHSLTNKMTLLKDNCVSLILEGRTTVEEYNRVVFSSY